MIRYKMFEREITSGDHRSYHVCVNNFGSNFKSKSKFHPIDEALSKIDEDFTDYECNITLANHTSPNDYFHISYLAKNLYPPYICLLYTSPSPRDVEESRMPSSA